MANSDARQTVKGNLWRAKLNNVCEWVKESWNNISDDIIINSFKTCGISNPINENINEEFEIIEISDDDSQDNENDDDNGDDNDDEDDDNGEDNNDGGSDNDSEGDDDDSDNDSNSE